MTKKQIEHLYMMIDICQDQQAVIDRCKEISKFLHDAWELYFFDGNYKKMEKVKADIWRHGSAKIAELRGLKAG